MRESFPGAQLRADSAAPMTETFEIRRPTLALFLMSGLLLALFGALSHRLGVHPFTGDEAFSAQLVDLPVGQILERLNQDEPHPPLFNLLMHTWRRILPGRDEFTFRLPSVFLGLLLVALVFRLGQALRLGPWAALAAAALVGLNPQLAVHLREARMYPAMVCSVAGATLAAAQFERLPRRWAVVAGAAASTAALLTHYFTAPFVAAAGLWGLLHYTGPTRRRFLYAQASAWLILALWLPTLGRAFFNANTLAQGKIWSFVLPPWESIPRLIEVGLWGYRGEPAGWVMAGAGIIYVSAWLLGSLWRAPRQLGVLFMGVALPLGAYALLCWIRPVFHPKYVLPWIMFMALGVGSSISRWPRLGGLAWLTVAAVMVVPWQDTLRRPYEPFISVPADSQIGAAPRDLARALTTYAAATDVFGLGTPDAAHCFYSQTYFQRDLGCALIPAYPTQTEAELSSQVTHLFHQHAVLWFLDFYNPSWDPSHLADAVLSEQALDLGSEQLAGRSVRLFTTAASVLSLQKPLGTDFGGAARLEGAWVRQGAALHLVLIWRSLADHPAAEAKVFVHLVDEAGQVVAQDDSLPVGWTRPLPSWALNEQLLDIHVLSLPPDWPRAAGTLRVGLYDPASLQRLPALDAAGRRLPEDVAAFPLNTLLQ